MRCEKCGECCRDTKMELCKADVARLERAGHHADEFSFTAEDGVRRLRNSDGHCVFYDPKERRCTEYARRPLGCVIYPVNMTPDGEVVVDESCPSAGSLSERELDEKGRRLRELLRTISSEARKHG